MSALAFEIQMPSGYGEMSPATLTFDHGFDPATIRNDMMSTSPAEWINATVNDEENGAQSVRVDCVSGIMTMDVSSEGEPENYVVYALWNVEFGSVVQPDSQYVRIRAGFLDIPVFYSNFDQVSLQN